MVVFARNGNELFRAEKLAVTDNGFHNLRERFAFFAIQYGLLFIGKNHNYLHSAALRRQK
jgi:hypothetical protein